MEIAMRGYNVAINKKTALLLNKINQEGARINVAFEDIEAVRIVVNISGASPELEDEIRKALEKM